MKRARPAPPLRPLAAVLLALAAAGCFFVPSSPDLPFVQVTVGVVDRDSVPVAGVRVEARGGWYREELRNVETTGAGGEVRFSLPQARYDFVALPPAGYGPVPPATETRAQLVLGGITEPQRVTLVLERAP